MVSEGFPAEADDLQTRLAAEGTRLANYHLEDRIGAGGMAVVFRARDERLQRLVALKVLAPSLAGDEAFRQRFIRESQAAAAVDDPHIIPVFEAGEVEGVLFLAMRYVPGGDVRALVRRAGPRSPAQALAIISPVASALDAAHSAGLVHRDVKLANILLDVRPGRPDHVYLSDFGLSKMVMSSLGPTRAGQFLGTPGYSPPEQLEGKFVDGRTDQYSLACATFELLCGQTPFPRDQVAAVIWAHISEAPPPLTSQRVDLPAAADDVLARALAKAPVDRYESCREFADALRAALGLEPYNSSSGATSHAELTRWPEGRQERRARVEIQQPAAGTAAVRVEPGAAATPSAAATAAPTGTGTAPSPSNSAPSQTDAEPDAGPAALTGDGEQRATPPRRDNHPRVAADGPGSGTGEVATVTADLAAGRVTAAPVGVATAHGLPPRRGTSVRSRLLRRVRLLPLAGILLLLVVAVIVVVLVIPGTDRPSVGHHASDGNIRSAPASPHSAPASAPGHSDQSTSGGTIPHGPAAYVLVGDAVEPVNLTTNASGKPIVVGGNASGIAVTRNGEKAFVTEGDTIIPVNLATGRPAAPIKVGYPLSAIAITPDGKTACVVDQMGVGTVIRVNLATGRSGKPIKVGHLLSLPNGGTVGDDPAAIVITPDGKTVYTANYEAWTVTPIDVATGTRGTPIKVGQNPNSIAIAPDGKTAYTANAGDGTVTPIDLATRTTRAPIHVAGAPWAIAITPNGKTAYVATVAGKLIPIDVAIGTLGKPIGGASYPQVAIAPDGKVAYVTGQFSQKVMPIHLATGTRGTPIKVGQYPQEIVIVR